MLSVFDHINQDSVILRCPGGGLSGGGANHEFSGSNNGWQTAGNGPYSPSTTSTVNNSSALTSSGAYTSELNTFAYDGANDNGGVYLSFDFLELDSWDGEEFSVYIGGTKFDLGNYRHTAAEDRNAAIGSVSDTAFWKKGKSAVDEQFGGSNGFLDQKHGFEIFLTDDFLQANTYKFYDLDLIEVTFTSTLDQGVADESWAVDNLVFREATEDDRSKFYVDNVQKNQDEININFSALAMDKEYSETKVGGLWSKFKDNLGDFRTQINELEVRVGGKSFADIETTKLEVMANNASDSFNTWFTAGNSYDQGFDYWGNALWDAMENQVADQTNFWDFLGNVTALFAATAAAGGPAGFIAGVTAFGNTIVTAIETDEGTGLVQVSPDGNGIGFLDGVSAIYEELQSRGTTTANTAATSLKNAVEGGYDAYYDFVANTQLLSHLISFEDGPDVNGIGINDYDELRELGFTVNRQGVFSGNNVLSNKITITDGTTELFTDKIEYWYTSGGSDVYQWNFG